MRGFTYVPLGTFFYHTNHLNSSTVITDIQGREITRINYLPYGQIDQAHSTGLDATTIKFTAQEYDEESELYYFRSRFYDAKLGSFLTPDTIVPDLSNSQAYNRYAYVYNNPIRYIDPTGHLPDYHDLADPEKTAEAGKNGLTEEELQILDDMFDIDSTEEYNKLWIDLIKIEFKKGLASAFNTQAKYPAFPQYPGDCGETCILVGSYFGIPGLESLDPKKIQADDILDWLDANAIPVTPETAEILALRGELVVVGLKGIEMFNTLHGHVATVRPEKFLNTVNRSYGKRRGINSTAQVMSRSIDGKNYLNKSMNWVIGAGSFTSDNPPRYYHIPR